jgi:hypothetical protein
MICANRSPGSAVALSRANAASASGNAGNQWRRDDIGEAQN